jgi:hypothetical protein
MDKDVRDAEALRLVQAFYQIADPEDRKLVIAIAEAAAREGRAGLMTVVADLDDPDAPPLRA